MHTLVIFFSLLQSRGRRHRHIALALLCVLFCVLCGSVIEIAAATAPTNNGSVKPNGYSCVFITLVGEDVTCQQVPYSCTAQGNYVCYNNFNEVVGQGSCGFMHNFVGFTCKYVQGLRNGDCYIAEQCDCSQIADDPCSAADCAFSLGNYENNAGGESYHCNCTPVYWGRIY